MLSDATGHATIKLKGFVSGVAFPGTYDPVNGTDSAHLVIQKASQATTDTGFVDKTFAAGAFNGTKGWSSNGTTSWR